MIKTKTVETVEEFDKDGKLVKKTVTETEETDDNPTRCVHTNAPIIPVQYPTYSPFQYSTITCSSDVQQTVTHAL